MKLSKNERIVTAYAVITEHASPLYVIIEGENHSLRTECIQQGERTPEVETLFAISYVVNNKMVAALEKLAWRSKR